MKNAVQTVTLYHNRLDPDTGYDVLVRYLIEGVSVFGKTEVRISDDGFASADVYTLRVPERCGMFPFCAGDLIVLGNASEQNPIPGALEKKYQTLTVVSCTDNRGKQGAHWKVICK